MFQTSARIFALDPMTRGFGYAVLEQPFNLLAWGIARVKSEQHEGAIAEFEQLLTDFEPGVVVLEDTRADGSRRVPRIRELIDALAARARGRGITVRTLARTAVLEYFSTPGTRATKYSIAIRLAREFSELFPKLPKPRKPWDSENERMAIFDALALAVTYIML